MIRKPSRETEAGKRRDAVRSWPHFAAASLFIGAALAARADGENITNEVQWPRAQNAVLQPRVQKQDDALDALTKKVEAREFAAHENAGDEPPPASGGLNFGKVNLSAEGGLAFFNTGNDGFSPDSEFRVDEARLFLEAPVWNGHLQTQGVA